MRTTLAIIMLCAVNMAHADESSSSSSSSASSAQWDEKAERKAERDQARRDKISTKRFAVCMKKTLGRFGDFKSGAEHQRAAELCKQFANPQ